VTNPLPPPQIDERTETRLARPWKVIVHDDPINLMTYVTHVFMRIFGYPRPRAEQLMLEVHQRGRSIVWTGDRERAEVYVLKLHAAHLLATLEPVEE
jgi:ATP-dependent Clp protease adaptor protein ClpS